MQRILAQLLTTIVTDYKMLTDDLGILHWYMEQNDIIEDLPNKSAIRTYIDLRNYICGTRTSDSDQQIINLFERKLQ